MPSLQRHRSRHQRPRARPGLITRDLGGDVESRGQPAEFGSLLAPDTGYYHQSAAWLEEEAAAVTAARVGKGWAAATAGQYREYAERGDAVDATVGRGAGQERE